MIESSVTPDIAVYIAISLPQEHNALYHHAPGNPPGHPDNMPDLDTRCPLLVLVDGGEPRSADHLTGRAPAAPDFIDQFA